MSFSTRSVYLPAIAVAVLAHAPPRAARAQAADTAAYRRAAEYSRSQRGDAVLVMVDGRVVFEAYHNRGAAETPHALHSGTKSFSGVLAVAAQQDGLLALDEPVSATITEWKADAGKRGITIRQLLSLTSGYEGGRSGRPPAYADAIGADMIAAPGAKFDYGPNPFQTFGELMKRKLASRQETVMAYLERRLLTPIGLRVGEWTGAAQGEPQLPSGAKLTAREWAKFGEFVRLGGAWSGRQLVPRDRLAELFVGTTTNPAYGVTWWLRTEVSPELKEEVKLLAMNLEGVDKIPGLDGMAVAAGAFKQRLFVIPAQRMVVVRFGRSGNRQFDDATFLRLLLGQDVDAPRRRLRRGE